MWRLYNVELCLEFFLISIIDLAFRYVLAEVDNKLGASYSTKFSADSHALDSLTSTFLTEVMVQRPAYHYIVFYFDRWPDIIK